MGIQPVILDHPLIQHKISLMRDKNTGSKEFRELITEVTMLMCFEATRDLPLKEVEIETPIALAKTKVISGRKLAFVPILRAGMGMLDGVLKLLPAAKVGHIGLYRDPDTHLPVEYYCKLPSDISERDVIVIDPMLATGGSAIDAISQVKKRGGKVDQIYVHHRGPRGARGADGRPSRRAGLYRRARRAAQREQVYRPGPRRRGGPHLRDQIILPWIFKARCGNFTARLILSKNSVAQRMHAESRQ